MHASKSMDAAVSLLRSCTHAPDDVQIIADKGYVGEQYVITPQNNPR